MKNKIIDIVSCVLILVAIGITIMASMGYFPELTKNLTIIGAYISITATIYQLLKSLKDCTDKTAQKDEITSEKSNENISSSPEVLIREQEECLIESGTEEKIISSEIPTLTNQKQKWLSKLINIFGIISLVIVFAVIIFMIIKLFSHSKDTELEF